MASFKIETRIKYFPEVTMVVGKLAVKANPYRRKDYHEDGSVSTYYGFEVDKSQFRKLKDTKWGSKT